MRVLWFWRVKVSVLIAVILLSLALMLTPSGFVRATDLDKKIVEAIQPLKEEQTTITGKLTTLSQQTATIQEALNELLAANVANNICRMLRRMVDEKEYNERRQTREETDVLQRRYKSLMGETYPEERCKE